MFKRGAEYRGGMGFYALFRDWTIIYQKKNCRQKTSVQQIQHIMKRRSLEDIGAWTITSGQMGWDVISNVNLQRGKKETFQVIPRLLMERILKRSNKHS